RGVPPRPPDPPRGVAPGLGAPRGPCSPPGPPEGPRLRRGPPEALRLLRGEAHPPGLSGERRPGFGPAVPSPARDLPRRPPHPRRAGALAALRLPDSGGERRRLRDGPPLHPRPFGRGRP